MTRQEQDRARRGIVLVDDPMSAAAAADQANVLRLPADSEEQAVLRTFPSEDDGPGGLFERKVADHASRRKLLAP
jgi:hypothetical protein